MMSSELEQKNFQESNDDQLTAVGPAFPDCDHCVVFISNDAGIAMVAVAVQSLAEHMTSDNNYDILLLHEGIGHEHIDNFTKSWAQIKNLKIRFVNISTWFNQRCAHDGIFANISKKACCELAIPWVLSTEYKKALFLDENTIVRHDINPIFDIELNENLIGAVRDYGYISDCFVKQKINKDSTADQICDDSDDHAIIKTMLLNLKEWRLQLSFEEVVDLCMTQQWHRQEQGVIDVLCRHKILFINPTWGIMSDCRNSYLLPPKIQQEFDITTDPIIVHFDDGRRPYERDYVEYDLEFWEYADKTLYMSATMEQVRSYEYRNYIAYSINKEAITVISALDGTKELYYKKVSLGKESQGWPRMRVIRINNSSLHLEGAVGFFDKKYIANTIVISLSVNGRLIAATRSYQERAGNQMLKKVSSGYAFIFDVPLNKNENKYFIRLIVHDDGKEIPLSRINYLRFAELSGAFANEYYANNGWTVQTEGNGTSLIVVKNTFFSLLWNECRFFAELLKRRTKAAKKAALIRLLAHCIRFLHRKPIWLISDRRDRAGDNGEVFYRYLKQSKRGEVNAYFILSHGSNDYIRMKPLGGIISPYSWRHKILALMADWCVSSQLDYLYRNPFDRPYYRDILRKTRFAYLKHGIVSNDLTRHLDKDIWEIDGLVVSTKNEYNNILNGQYHYTDKQIWLTGLPRFDILQDKREKIVTILPTWRMYLFSRKHPITGVRYPLNGFENTNFVKFYKNLLQNTKLRNLLSRYGYALRFMPHPTCRPYMAAFQIPNDVTFPENISYQEIYKMSSLIVTDYSSSIYDFIYLKKPVVYCQFDEEQFFAGTHVCNKGDFNYERDGFGEVTYNSEQLIAIIANYLEKDCELHEPYKTRIEAAFLDRSPTHCERLFMAIREQGIY